MTTQMTTRMTRLGTPQIEGKGKDNIAKNDRLEDKDYQI